MTPDLKNRTLTLMLVRLSIFLSIFINFQLMAQEKPVLIYIGDPLCSWCYGFSPEISKAVEQLGSTVDFQLVMGGLRPYNTETMVDLGDFLKEHWDHVSQRSDVTFRYEILKDESFVYDTEPPCRAVVVMRKLRPDKEFEFFKAVQKAFYYENENTGDVNTYLAMMSDFGVDPVLFKTSFESEEMKMAVKTDFQLSSSLGVSGFPSTVLKYNGKYYQISNGFVQSDELVESVKSRIQ